MLLGRMSRPSTPVAAITSSTVGVPAEQQVVDAVSSVCGLTPRPTDSEPCGSKSTSSTLRPSLGQRGPEVDRGGGLADAALLVAHGDDHRGAVLGERLRLGQVRPGTPGGSDLRRRARSLDSGGRLWDHGVCVIDCSGSPSSRTSSCVRRMQPPATPVAGRGMLCHGILSERHADRTRIRRSLVRAGMRGQVDLP